MKKSFIIGLLSFAAGGILQQVFLEWHIPFLKEWYGFLSVILFCFIISVVIYNLFLKKKHTT